MSKAAVQPFFDEITKTVTFIVVDQASRQAAIIDPVLNLDPGTRALSTFQADKLIDYLDQNNLQLEWLLETHLHTDHISASHYLRERRGGQIGISEQVTRAQHSFQRHFNLDTALPCDGRGFDYFFKDGEVIFLGHLELEVMATPGHAPDCVSYKIEDMLFVGPAILMPDCGTARTDLPGSSSKAMYQSIQKILSLPDHTRIFVGLDHKSQARECFACETSVFEERRDNVHLREAANESEFIRLKKQIKNDCSARRLWRSVIPLNMRAGQIPEKNSKGICFKA